MKKSNLKVKIKDVKNGKVVLAHGETGNVHGFVDGNTIELLEDNDGNTFIEVKAATSLIHEEHTKHDLDQGFGEVRIQREWSFDNVRRVAD